MLFSAQPAVRVRRWIGAALAGALVAPLIAVVAATPASANCSSIPSTRDLAVTRVVYRTGRDLHVNDRVMLAGFETGWVESHMNNLNCGDRDSLGVFQQRPSQGWGTAAQVRDVRHASTSFFTRAVSVNRAHPTWSAGRVAQAVQVSAYPDRYDQAAGRARAMIDEVAVRPDLERVSDFNGDGRADVLGVDAAGALWYYRHATGNAFAAPVEIGHGWQTFRQVMAADWSGDGAADVLGVNASGDLLYYPNNGFRLSSPQKIGHGWQSFRQVVAADWTGDGHADVLGIAADQNLYLYPHQGTGFGSRVKIGANFGAVTHLMSADFSGDGHADVLAVTTDGKLWYYPHQGAGLSSGRQIGHGWQGFTQVIASDFNGDGIADLLGVDAAGKLWFYRHTTGTGFATRVQIGQGWGTFRLVI